MATQQPVAKFVQVDGLCIHDVKWGNSTFPPLIKLRGIARSAFMLSPSIFGAMANRGGNRKVYMKIV